MSQTSDDWDWSPSIVFEDGSPADVGSEESISDRRRREVARLLRDEGDGLTSRQVCTRLRSYEVGTIKTLGELCAAGVVARRRDPDDRRFLRYHWVGGCEVSDL